DAEFVFKPSASLRFGIAAGGKLFPVVIDLVLRVAHDLEGNGFADFEHWSTVKGGKRLAIDFKSGDHDRTGGLAVMFLADSAIALDLCDLGVLENRDVKV